MRKAGGTKKNYPCIRSCRKLRDGGKVIRFPLLIWLMMILTFGLAVLYPAHDGHTAATPEVRGLRVGENPGFTRLVIDADRRLDVKILFLAAPYRMVIDLPEVTFAIAAKGHAPGRGVVGALRFGLFKPGVSRIVLDLARPVRLSRRFDLPPRGTGNWRLVFDLRPVAPADYQVTREPLAEVNGANVTRPSTAQELPARPKARPKIPARPLIYLDPGHGGMDPGAPGALGTPEKYITLAVAREARRVIQASGRYRARLTRERDVFLPLRRRIAIARAGGADLFVSLHADSLKNRRVRGATVYTLSETASDREAAALAARENKADVLAGLDLGREAPEVADILISLAQREAMNRASHFANLLVPELRKRIRVRRNAHRFAGFVVLKAPDVPSVLVEMGYLSNRQDAAMMGAKAGRRRIAEGLLAGIDRYFSELRAASGS